MKKSELIDIHVHLVGNGKTGSGCWLRLEPWRRPFAQYMLRHVGLPSSALEGDLESALVDRLVQLLRESSLDRLVLLAQEAVYDSDGTLRPELGTAFVPNDYLFEVCRAHPEFLPGVSIHPARRDALEELERCLEQGAVLMKCLPNCQNIDCREPAYLPFWERMAEAGLPLLAHTGGEHTLQVVRPELADPRILEAPLRCGVTVIAAHAATRSGLTDPQYFSVLVEMMGRYPNLYADISAFNVPIRGRVVSRCLESDLARRLVHGSDFPVPVHGHWPWLRGQVRWADFRRWEACPNVLERDYRLKKAMGFPEPVFTRAGTLLRRT